MAIPQRRTVMIVALVLYWPTIFILAHIPVPDVVKQAHMSDKSLHYLMYMILTMLLWSVVKPYSRVSWRLRTPWLLFAIVTVYAVLDELLQHFVRGRSADPKDLVADMLGTVAGLLVLTFFSFWPSLLIAAGSTIYILAVFTRANLTRLLPVTATVFHLATYGLFTLLWIGYLRQFSNLRMGQRRWFVATLVMPAVLLGVTKASTLLSHKDFEGWDMVAGAAGIATAVAVAYGVGVLWRRRSDATIPSKAQVS